MSSGTRATLVLTATLFIGTAIGALGVGALAQQRRDRPPPPGGAGGFVGHMERVIQPHDDAQRDVLRPFLEAADQRNREIIQGAEAEMRGVLADLMLQVDELIDADQRERLRETLERTRPLAPGPRGRPPGGPPERPGPPPS